MKLDKQDTMHPVALDPDNFEFEDFLSFSIGLKIVPVSKADENEVPDTSRAHVRLSMHYDGSTLGVSFPTPIGSHIWNPSNRMSQKDEIEHWFAENFEITYWLSDDGKELVFELCYEPFHYEEASLVPGKCCEEFLKRYEESALCA